MFRLILIYGLIAGLIIKFINLLNYEFGRGQAWLAYLVMLIAFSTIYVAVRQYRDDTLGGVIGFVPALLLGLGISAVAGGVYVGIWEIYLIATEFEFVEYYAAIIVEANTTVASDGAELASAAAAADEFREQYLNPLIRIPMTFLEVFPVGLIVSFVSAGLLKNHKSAG